VIVVYAIAKDPAANAGPAETVVRSILDPAEPIPLGAVWIDMIEPTAGEDRKVQDFVGAAVPSKADPDYTEPPEAQYAEDGVRYMSASVVSEPDDTPDVVGVTFVVAPSTLVTVRYHRVDSFELFGRKLAKASGKTLFPDALAVGLINTVLNMSARSLGKAGQSLDAIASTVFRARGDQGQRSRIYFETLNALGREDERISNLRESMASLERVLLFLTADGRADNAPKAVRGATKAALRDLQALEEDASFKAQKVQFLLDATLGLINLAQNDIIKLFSVLAVIFMPPTVIASIYGMNFKAMPELEWTFGYPMALALMVLAAVVPYLFFRWKRWL